MCSYFFIASRYLSDSLVLHCHCQSSAQANTGNIVLIGYDNTTLPETLPLWIHCITHFLLTINHFVSTLIAKVLASPMETMHFFAKLCMKCIALLRSSYVEFCIYFRSAMVVVHNIIKNHYPSMVMMMMKMMMEMMMMQKRITPLIKNTMAEQGVNATQIFGEQLANNIIPLIKNTIAEQGDNIIPLVKTMMAEQGVNATQIFVEGFVIATTQQVWNLFSIAVCLFSLKIAGRIH